MQIYFLVAYILYTISTFKPCSEDLLFSIFQKSGKSSKIKQNVNLNCYDSYLFQLFFISNPQWKKKNKQKQKKKQKKKIEKLNRKMNRKRNRIRNIREKWKRKQRKK